MNNLYNMFKKILPGKDSEKKLKEEEDPNAEINLLFEINPMKSSEILNNCVKDLKIGGVNMESYDVFIKSLNKLIAQNKLSTREIDYRYSKIAEKEGIEMGNLLNNLFLGDSSDVEKMKKIGKIGVLETKLDATTLQGKAIFSYSKRNFKFKFS
jgi:hypothetical protein